MASIYSTQIFFATQDYPYISLEQPFSVGSDVVVVRTIDHFMVPSVASSFSITDGGGHVLVSVAYSGSGGGEWEHVDTRHAFTGDFSLVWNVNAPIALPETVTLAISGYRLSG